MEESQSAASAAGGPPRSIEVNKTGTASAAVSGQSTPTTIGTATTNTNNHGGNTCHANAVEFTARDAKALSTPDLGAPNAAAARPNLSVSTSSDVPPSSSVTSTSTSPTSRPSPRSQTLRSSLSASRTTLHASLHSYAQTQNTHLESAFGALMQSIQEHTDELDVHQDNIDR